MWWFYGLNTRIQKLMILMIQRLTMQLIQLMNFHADRSLKNHRPNSFDRCPTAQNLLHISRLKCFWHLLYGLTNLDANPSCSLQHDHSLSFVCMPEQDNKLEWEKQKGRTRWMEGGRGGGLQRGMSRKEMKTYIRWRWGGLTKRIYKPVTFIFMILLHPSKMSP